MNFTSNLQEGQDEEEEEEVHHTLMAGTSRCHRPLSVAWTRFKSALMMANSALPSSLSRMLGSFSAIVGRAQGEEG